MDGNVWKNLLEGYGQRVTLRRGGEDLPVRAFFQPVRERAPGEEQTPLGEAPAGKYLYLGPPEIDPEGVEELVWEGRSFRFIRARAVPVGERAAYRWALAEERDRGERS